MKETFEEIAAMKGQVCKKKVIKKIRHIASQYLLGQVKSKGQEMVYGQ